MLIRECNRWERRESGRDGWSEEETPEERKAVEGEREPMKSFSN